MIEKNIFQSWYTKDLHPDIQKKIDIFKELNSDYNYYLYDDNEIDNFVNKYFPGEIADCYNKLNIIVAKVDFWRYLVLYKYGGVYLDMDSDINVSLDKFIKKNDQAIITRERNSSRDYVQWGLLFSKEHPILKKTIEFVCNNIINNLYPNDVRKMTGPTIFTKAINKIHSDTFNQSLYFELDDSIDKIFTSNNISYRILGIDYNGYLTWKYDISDLLYINKKHWTQEEKETPLLKKD